MLSGLVLKMFQRYNANFLSLSLTLTMKRPSFFTLVLHLRMPLWALGLQVPIFYIHLLPLKTLLSHLIEYLLPLALVVTKYLSYEMRRQPATIGIGTT